MDVVCKMYVKKKKVHGGCRRHAMEFKRTETYHMHSSRENRRQSPDLDYAHNQICTWHHLLSSKTSWLVLWLHLCRSYDLDLSIGLANLRSSYLIGGYEASSLLLRDCCITLGTNWERDILCIVYNLGCRQVIRDIFFVSMFRGMS